MKILLLRRGLKCIRSKISWRWVVEYLCHWCCMIMCVLEKTLDRSGVFMWETASLEKAAFEVQPLREDPHCSAVLCYTLLCNATHVMCSRHWACELSAVSKTRPTSITGTGAFRLSFAKLTLWMISSEILWCGIAVMQIKIKIMVALSFNKLSCIQIEYVRIQLFNWNSSGHSSEFFTL